MGLNSDAELIWGIPVLAYDEETGEPTEFWDVNKYGVDEGDWIEFHGDLEIRSYGHYEDPYNQRGILTSSRVKHLSGDCWKPGLVIPGDLATQMNNDKLYSKSEDEARAEGLGVSFYKSANWWLVASYG